MRRVTMCCVLLAVTLFNAEAKTIKVPQDYVKIQSAIDAAVNGDTVLVAEGTYTENIVLRKKIVVGSNFIVDNDTAHISKTILDGGSPVHVDSASVVRIFAGTDTTTVIIGFTIRNGKGTKLDLAGSADWISGGGILVWAGGAKITHNIITGNTLSTSLGVYGGGITVDPSLGPISYWVIEYNQIINNVISTSATSSVGAEGAGVWLTEDGRFVNNIVASNIASASTVYATAGGINIIGATGYGTANIRMDNNIVRNNLSKWGGGISMYVDPTQAARPNVTLINNVVTNNFASLLGAAIHLNSGDYVLINNTFANNIGPQAFYLNSSRGSLSFRLLNNIFWNPSATDEFNSVVSVTGSYNNIRGGMIGTGNINSDPLFVANDSMFHLSNSSPCISAGIYKASVNGVLLTAMLSDYFGDARPRPSGMRSDLGAIEHDSGSVLDPTLGVKEIYTNEIPTDFSLSQNYPNPFNPSTTIRYALPSSSHIAIVVYDMLGREISVLVDEQQSPGWKEVEWKAKDVSSGIYFYKLTAHQKDGGQAGAFVETKKMMVVK